MGTLLESIDSPGVAEQALAAVASGGLVLAGLPVIRANEVFGYFSRLGIDPNDLSRRLSLVVAESLLRKVCKHCAVIDDSEDLRNVLAGAANTWLAAEEVRGRMARAGGCRLCRGSGYDGVALAYEVLEIDTAARALVEEGLTGMEMERRLLCDGKGLWDQGLRLLARGLTSLEALRYGLREPR